MMLTKLPQGEVLVIEGWLKPELCEQIRDELAFSWWRPSELAYLDDAGRQKARLSVLRTSSTCAEDWMGETVQRLLRRMETRLERQFDLASSHLEAWQAARYRRGQHFDEHHDAGMFATSPEGERTATVLLYLDDHEQGGATIFPALGRRIRPAAGTLVLWRNLLPDGTPDPRMRHVARPARKAKTILTTWARERACRSLPHERSLRHETEQSR